MTNKLIETTHESAHDEIERLFEEELAKLSEGRIMSIAEMSDLMNHMKAKGLTATTISKEIEDLEREIQDLLEKS